MDYFNYDSKLKPEKGRLLISQPFLPDPNFERTVILLCEHNEDGSFGFVLNKLTQLKVDEIFEGINGFNAKVYLGGPVQHNTFHFIHCDPDMEDSNEIKDGLFWGGNFDQFKLWAESGSISENSYRFFIGYSGWGSGQLEEELETGSWIIAENENPLSIFATGPEELWKATLNGLGGRFQIYSGYPTDPRLN